MPNLFEINIEGLSEAISSLNSAGFTSQVKLGVGLATRNLEDSLRQTVSKRYNISTVTFNRSLVSMPSGMQDEGVISVTEFKYIPIGLGAFSSLSMFEWGNIPPYPKKRKGKVYSVEVKRGSIKVSHGKYGFGGFMVNRGGKYVMLERTAAGRTAPLHGLYAPSITQMVGHILNNISSYPIVSSTIDNFGSTILEQIKL